MYEHPVSSLDGESDCSRMVQRAMLQSVETVTNPKIVHAYLAGLKDIERDQEFSPYYSHTQQLARARAASGEGDLHFSLRPMDLTPEEAAEYNQFRARPSKLQGMEFKRVPAFE
jgi:hypothetical protein